MAAMWTAIRYLGLGALAALGWLVAAGVDLESVPAASLASPVLDVPLWTRIAVRAALVLSIPALALLLNRPARTWLGDQRGFLVAIVLPALLVAALPALVPCPWSRPEDGLALPLHVPTASLGVALGIVGGVRGPQQQAPAAMGYGARVLASTVGFGLFLLLAGAALIFSSLQFGSCTGQCGGLIVVAIAGIALLALFSAATGIFAGFIGYAAGLGLNHLAKRPVTTDGE